MGAAMMVKSEGQGMNDTAPRPSRLLRDVKMRDKRIVLAVAEKGGILKAPGMST
jgi:hypothetical protein